MNDRACTKEPDGHSARAPAETIQIDIGRIMEMIPHRPPFLMIDRVVGVVANERATGIKNVSINEHYFQGHFPARPVMPGVLVIEAMAQTAAVLVVHTLGPEAEGKLVYFMSVDNARFRRPVFPGDQLAVHVVKQRSRGNVWKFDGEAKVGGNLMAEATFAAMILDR
ncbi:MAG TPA: 3-hydroxyacyl-ACP dehydratase FabZ [Stellaceae bacterium]|jgi:3-hydroxyacyl-[acyl-carrier-protein] dehydratase|nr:3-hydroxyacyl-ACP dehydratase FabZ [Stellaceae bacterium]